MTDHDDMTLGEVGRRLVRIEVKLDNMADSGARIASLERRADSQEERAWQSKLALAVAVLGALLTLVVSVVGTVLMSHL